MTMAVSSVLLVLLASMLEGSLTAYTGQQRRSSATVETRAGLEILRADLRSFCALRDDPEVPGDDTLPRFLHLPAADVYGSDRVAFLRRMKTTTPTAAVSTTPDVGSLVMVAYAVGFTPDASGFASQKLFRRQYTPQETLAKLQASAETGVPWLDEVEWKQITTPPQSSSSDPAAGGTGNPAAATSASVAEPVVFQVVRFKITPLAALLTDLNDPASINGVAEVIGGAPWPAAQRPACVDITLRVTNRGTAAKLETEADWRGQGRFPHLLLGNPPTPLRYDDDPEVETQQLRVHLPRF